MYVTLCPFLFCNYLDKEERAGCFALFVILVARDWCVVLTHDGTGLSAVCDCGISWSYSLTIFAKNNNKVTPPAVSLKLATLRFTV